MNLFVRKHESDNKDFEVQDGDLQVLEKLPYLQRLHLVNQKKVTLEGLKQLTGLKYLASLALVNMPIDDTVISVLVQIPSLTRLRIAQIGNMEDGIQILMDQLSNLQHLSPNGIVDTQ